MLHGVLADLRRAEETLAELAQRAPDPERAVHLAAIRAAIAQLEASCRGPGAEDPSGV
jgi:hypothetical protein